jgi:hypothetical protein
LLIYGTAVTFRGAATYCITMRHLTTVFALLVACAPETAPDPDPSTARVPDAGTNLCPLAHAEGVTRASWFPDVGCAYACAPETHQRCGDAYSGRTLTAYGTCVRLSDRANCGACGNACETREDCVKPAGSAWFVCVARLR